MKNPDNPPMINGKAMQMRSRKIRFMDAGSDEIYFPQIKPEHAGAKNPGVLKRVFPKNENLPDCL